MSQATGKYSPEGSPYTAPLNFLRQQKTAGASFGETIIGLDRLGSATQQKREIMGSAGSREVYGIHICGLPLMGGYNGVIMDLAATTYRMVLKWAIQDAMSDTNVIVDVAAGTGALIIELALGNPKKRFIANDISENAVTCTELLADIAGASNVEVMKSDVRELSLGMFSADTAPLFIAANVLDFYPVSEQFFDNLSQINGARLCAFCTMSDQLKSEFPDLQPLMVPQFVTSIGREFPVWEILQPYFRDGRFTLERLVPDLVGPAPLYPMSFVQLRVS